MSFAWLLLSSPVKSIFVSALFDFSDSPNDTAPGSPTLFAVVLKRADIANVSGYLLCVLFCIHQSD